MTPVEARLVLEALERALTTQMQAYEMQAEIMRQIELDKEAPHARRVQAMEFGPAAAARAERLRRRLDALAVALSFLPVLHVEPEETL